jgi:putative ATP-binding cassette transporter
MRRSMTNFFTGLREGWSLAKPYFASDERWAAIGLLASVVILNLMLTGLNVQFTYWTRYTYNALQNKDFATFMKLIFLYSREPVFPYFVFGYVGYAAIFTVISVYALYLNQMLQIRWRQWMTRDFAERWLADRAFYNISLAKAGTIGIDNPDQRISQDLADFTASILSLGLDLLSNLVTLLSFVTVLFVISGSIKVFGVKIPGYMLWLAIIYSFAGTWITHLIGKKLIQLNFNQQKVEADFRYGLIRVRENTEAIALAGGEGDELISLKERFSHVRDNWWAIMRRTKLLGFFTNTFNSVAGNFALIAASPRFFAGALQLGDLLQISSVFANVQAPLSWVVGAYTDLVSLRATISRLHGFREAVAAARIASTSGPQVSAVGSALSLSNLTLSLPDGRKLINNASLTLPPGLPVVLTGPSGAGKSTLFRAIAGIWPFGEGSITRPSGSVLFLPQKPYFPLGSLKRTVVYPGVEAEISDDAVRQALESVDLAPLAQRLHDVENWGQILSGGEQQRLAIARALIAKPDWLFLDEATSAMEVSLAARIHTMLRRLLPNTTIVAISHQETETLPGRHLTLTPGALASSAS